MVDAQYAPMEMRAVDAIPEGPAWQYEPKWDGFRALVHRDGDRVAITSKNGQPLARYFPEVVAALAALGADGFSLDGELVVPVAGAFSFDTLQQRIHPAASRVQMLARKTPALYLVFDLLREEGADRVGEPLERRREALERFMHANAEEHGTLRLSPATRDRAVVDRWFAEVGGALDGVIAKRLGVPYASGRRDAAVKIKKQRTADCVVGGFCYAAGSTDRVGSLMLGLYDDAGLLDYIGFCSSFSTAERRALLERLLPHAGGSGFTGGAPGDAPSRWSRDPERDRSYVALAPELVLEVGFDQVTGGRIRHGTRPLRWRTDKAPRSCTVDQLETAGAVLSLIR
ncbi:ATP-dependent DNA ligase [Vulcanimicrobium alpinum]|uniref:DNA ligase (ATP) n=1 Tax=Vulcanimicrobium alpinum TaxID=3016050 RepID=A0AAN2C9H2_UNVUL|nr:ATP-dependent DNA ligase [Vulcanimicrobium alpinum]BDE06011.1 ATP-dependent DNA ligase [Vulcanimicrobium alpinum]